MRPNNFTSQHQWSEPARRLKRLRLTLNDSTMLFGVAASNVQTYGEVALIVSAASVVACAVHAKVDRAWAIEQGGGGAAIGAINGATLKDQLIRLANLPATQDDRCPESVHN